MPARKKGQKAGGQQQRLSPEEFVLRAIESLRTPPYEGIHSVYSGFNEAFRQYFPNLDPVKEVTKLAKAGKVTTRPCRGGVTIYAGEGPSQKSRGEEALQKMGVV